MIRITYTSDVHRAAPKEYDTDDLAEVLIAEAEAFRLRPEREGDGDNRGPDTWVFAFIVERDGERLEPHEISRQFKKIANMESIRSERP